MTTIYIDLAAQALLLADLTVDGALTITSPSDDLEVIISSTEQGSPGSCELKTLAVTVGANTVFGYTGGPSQTITLTENIVTLAVINWPDAGIASAWAG